MPEKYAKEVNLVIGQVIDISRIVLLQSVGDNKQAVNGKDISSLATGHMDTSQANLVLPSANKQPSLSMTTGTAALNIIQIQNLAFSEERL